MRILALVLLLAACSEEGADKPPDRLLYAGQGRDRLCIVADRVGFIAFGQGDSNCSARGRLTNSTIIPDGDPDCRIPIERQADTIRFGRPAAACSYYCGPGGDFAGRAFSRAPSASPAVDFAGDPLC
jgi:hypothetical protein